MENTNTREINIAEAYAKQMAKSEEVMGSLNNTAKQEDNLKASATMLISSCLSYLQFDNVQDLWIGEVNKATMRTEKGLSNIVCDPLIAVSESGEFGKKNVKTQQFSKYARSILGDIGYLVREKPTEMVKLFKEVNLKELNLSDYKNLLASVRKIGKHQNKDFDEKVKFTFNNIIKVPKEKEKIFSMLKDSEVIAYEAKIKETKKGATNPVKAVTKVLKTGEFDLDKTSLETFTASLEVLMAEVRANMIKAYSEAVAEVKEAETADA